MIVSIITLIHSDNYLEKIATKITLADIAREARVGVATVDRVLNKRAAVKESTARRVLEAARRLGFTLEQPHYRLAAGKAPVTIRMGFILLQESHSFYLPLARALTREAAPWLPAGQAPVILHFAIDAVEAMAQAIHRLSDEVEVLGLVALDHPLIRHAVAGPPPAACACSPCFPICRSPSAAGISASIIIKPGAPPPGLSSAYAGGMAKLALSLAIIVLPARKAVRSAFAPACENRARGNRSLSRFAVMNGRISPGP